LYLFKDAAMSVVNMREAKTHLSQLVGEVESGAAGEIVIARSGEPVARLVPIRVPAATGKRLSLLEGPYFSSSQPEFDASNEDVARLFGRTA
jgi:prevent-host-death family protein